MRTLRLEDLPAYTYDNYKQWEDKWEFIYGIFYAMHHAPMIKYKSVTI